MSKLKLTDAAVARIKAVPGRRMEYFDTAEPGFGLRVSGTPEKAIKTWIFLSRVKGELPSPGGKRPPLRRLTIGPYPAYGLAEARDKAREARKLADRGIDPATQRKAEAEAAQHRAREVRTIASVVDEFMRRYMEHGKRPHSRRYIAETRRNFDNHVLAPWGERRAAPFGGVQTCHRSLNETSNAGIAGAAAPGVEPRRKNASRPSRLTASRHAGSSACSGTTPRSTM